MYARFYGILNFAKTGVTGYFNLLPLLNEQKNQPQKKWRFMFHVNWNDFCIVEDVKPTKWIHVVEGMMFVQAYSVTTEKSFFVCESDASVTHMHVHERRIFFSKVI